eukprot:CAMPEP_0177173366 /NCGR_PEP_ID=MMETSP0367-20130122/11618_1 /TAXON_ID=447022 ORGANISM="Scrippsiella hangoei-like, Strain SHHI-4" /NCGR_SAMPLE_ID=MMETSP0367 /ASSEMBLY_ACC=CAM_ASM_000362 /LENGTH=86 /DNA_ID=CAMNT_0018619675 /DNA_START=648 /DNA_END=908 /DNA_ORIENTATION=-
MPKDSKYPPAGDKAAAPAEFLRPNMRIRHGGLTTDRPPELRPIANHDRLLHRGSDPTTAAGSNQSRSGCGGSGGIAASAGRCRRVK